VADVRSGGVIAAVSSLVDFLSPFVNNELSLAERSL
jgi:hypothetical protein